MAWRLRFLKGILVNFFGGGGVGGRIRPHCPVADLNDTTINKHMWGGGWNGRDMASRLRFYEGIFVDFFGRVGFKAQRF
jgi:hypothetical protein